MRKILSLVLLTIFCCCDRALALSMEGYVVADVDRVFLVFSEAVDDSGAVVTDEAGERLSEFLSADGMMMVVVYDAPIVVGSFHSITVAGVRGVASGTVFNGGMSFYMPKRNDVIVNEIMHDVNPTVSLPAAKYVEIYNQSAYSIPLDYWSLSTGDYVYELPSVSIPSHAYCLICAKKDSAVLRPYASVAPVKTLDHLLAGGTSVVLRHTSGSVIDHVQYTSEWHSSAFKQQGGWSLERIDAKNLTAEGNWTSSVDLRGGTPGGVNSVNGVNPDSILPRLECVAVPAADTLCLYFNKEMDAVEAADAGNYTFMGHRLKDVALVGPENRVVVLTLDDGGLVMGEGDTLIINELRDVSGIKFRLTRVYVSLPEKVEEYNDVVINEVLFNPREGGVDFVEVYNPTEHTWDLSSIFVASRKDGELQKRYVVADMAALLAPYAYCCITSSPNVVRSQYECGENPYFLKASLPSLPNAEGDVALVTASGVVIDELAYTEKMHHPIVRDARGVSLERISPLISTLDVSNWQSAASECGYATPCRENSQYYDVMSKSEVDGFFHLDGKSFSPDGDGYHDVLRLLYEMPADGYVLNADIYSANGVCVSHWQKNALLATSGVLFWDGLDDDGAICNVGVYVLYVEYVHPSGKKGREKFIFSLTSH